MNHRFWEVLAWRQRPGVRWIAVVTWMGVIFFASGQSQFPNLVKLPGFQDIAGHFIAYGVLALLWRWALSGAGVARPGRWAFVLTLLYGLSDEFHQSFVPGRHPDLLDIVTDAVGAASALVWAKLRACNRR